MTNNFDEDNGQGDSRNSDQTGGSQPIIVDVPIPVEWVQKDDPRSRPSSPKNNIKKK